MLSNCPEWEYEHHPRRPELPSRVAGILRDLASGAVDTLALALDSRDAHLRVFHGLTPHGCGYYAGHYRGERYRCLRSCEVGVSSDHRVGAPPTAVGLLMRELGTQIEAGVRAIDGSVLLDRGKRLHYIVALVCHVFEVFLRVHPYVNGNGHVGRLIVWSMLVRYGHWPRQWPIDPRPPDPPYVDLIKRYRDGETLPFEQHILAMLLPP